ncbi:chemotaxis protein CheW [Brevibacillus migulae]|uniref:chemotaxis protein CheW n=1 Tax=Brevibacillus migulae TaxID=1644114 RepID=UPI00143123C1|nr:chemotaxis protein CheW [Brevibacillus migulae]
MDAVSVKKEGKFVVFSVGEEVYSLGIEEVLEIIRPRPITSIEGVKKYIEGVIHLRGNIIPVVNLRSRLGLPAKQLDKHGRVLIVKGENDEKIGLVVDFVKKVTNIQDNEMEGTPDPMLAHTEGFVIGMAKQDDQVIGMLDLRRLLYPTESEGE